MPRSIPSRIPKYRLHKPSGLAVVRLDGRDHYLGSFKSEESHKRYEELVAKWLGEGLKKNTTTQTPPESAAIVSDLTVNELLLEFLQHARSYYVKNGKPTGEISCIKEAIKPWVELYGTTAVASFGPLALKRVRDSFVTGDISRGVINARINRIRRIIKWAVENQRIEASVLQGLQAVAPLKRGRCNVREAPAVRPVSDEWVEKTMKSAPAAVAAMINLQQLTGMRPGEVVMMRTGDLEAAGRTWQYRPESHKTEHHGRQRVIFLGPHAQLVIKPFLKKDLAAYIFSPAEVMEERRRAWRGARKSPMTPSQMRRTRKATPKRAPGSRYNTPGYGNAIKSACDKAFPHPLLSKLKPSKLTDLQREELTKWRKAHRWHPNQLRHSAATFLRREFGIEAARVVLGHASAAVTEVYAELDLTRAADIMEQVG